MAFVYEQQRNINEVSKLNSNLGPGQYFHHNEQINKFHQCAPFDSSNNRKSLFDQNKKIPGPGQYEIIQPFIQPNMKTMSNNQNIIVKINSTGTVQFKSALQRFKNQQSQVPGPGKYNININKSINKKSNSSKSITDGNLSKRIKQLNKIAINHAPAIPSKVQGLKENRVESEDLDSKLGPCFYNPMKRAKLNLASTVWGKDKTRRFSLDNKIDVGPGKYRLDYNNNNTKDENKLNQITGSFKSATARTYFDSIFYRTNLDQKVTQRSRNKYKSNDIAPGHYNATESSFIMKQKPLSFQFFGSTVQRFNDGIEDEINPNRNTFYNIKSNLGCNTSFNKTKHGFLSVKSREAQFLNIEQNNPGPGTYKQRVNIQKKLKGKNIQQFGSTTQRPFYKIDEQNQIGLNKFYLNDDQKRFKELNTKSYYFKSDTKRNPFELTNKHNLFAQYNINYYDVSKKIEKQKNFIENLKKIDIEKAPFQSSYCRFPHYQKIKKNNNNKNKNQQQNSTKIHELKVKQQNQKIRTNILSINKQQILQKNKNSSFNKKQRFEQNKKKTPGVGSYEVILKNQNKSYNIKYKSK